MLHALDSLASAHFMLSGFSRQGNYRKNVGSPLGWVGRGKKKGLAGESEARLRMLLYSIACGRLNQRQK
jgi:hypothetical protein